MAELAKAHSMQPYIILYKTTLQLGVRNVPKVMAGRTTCAFLVTSTQSHAIKKQKESVTTLQ